MKKTNIISIIGISVILLSLMLSIVKPEYDTYCNIAAIIAFAGVCLYQIWLVYKSGGAWKKYFVAVILLIVLMTFILLL